MNKHIILLSLLFFFLTSCETREEKSETAVREYISALKNQNWIKAKGLIFDPKVDDDAVRFASDAESKPTNNVEGNIFDNNTWSESSSSQQSASDKDLFNINTWRHLSIKDIDDIKVIEIDRDSEDGSFDKGLPQLSSLIKSARYILSEYLVKRAYLVKVKSGENDIYFIVIQTSKNRFLVYKSEGLYDYDVDGMKGKIGYDIQLLNKNYKSISRYLKDLKNFNIFSDAINENNNSTKHEIFPDIKNHDATFRNTPKARKYKQFSESSIIICEDSSAYIMDDYNKISDCYHIISAENLIKEIESYGVKPLSRKSDKLKIMDQEADLAYISRLSDQKNRILDEIRRKEAEKRRIEEEKKREEEERNKEKERKARVAKYKAQGVALLSSGFTNNGNGAKGVKFEAVNTSNKTAKYIIIEVVGYNAVNDPVWDGGYVKRCQGIGPVSPGEAWSWSFNELWERGDIVDSYKIKALIIQFSDGTSKRVNNPKELPNNWRDWYY